MNSEIPGMFEPELSAFVINARDRYGRAGLIALVELCRRELANDAALVPTTLVGP